MKRIANIIMSVAGMLTASSAQAFTIPRIHCSEDTVRAVAIMQTLGDAPADAGRRLVLAAKELEGSDVGNPGWNDSAGTLTLDLHTFDGLAFVNNAIALAKGSMTPDKRWFDYSFALEGISRRKGNDTGPASQMIYGSDWIVDNVYRGNIVELTDRYNGGYLHKTKSLEAVSRNLDKYPALKDSAAREAVKMFEMGYRTHRIPHLKKEMAGKSDIISNMRDGDIIMMLCKDDDFDLYDIGIVAMRDDGPHLIHCDRNTGKVREDPFPLKQLFKKENQFFYGYRWLRLKER